MIIDHIELGISGHARSVAFYRQAFAPPGIELIVEVEGRAGLGRDGKAEFWFGSEDGIQRPMPIATHADDRAAVDAFYRAAPDAGGRDYGAFLPDPGGHNIEAVCHRPA